MNKLLMAISARLPMRVINNGERPYLQRYYLCTLAGWRFYLHRFVGSDADSLHDHPWRKAYSLVLSGFYWEWTRMSKLPRMVRWFNSLHGDTFHRVELPTTGAECWTLFMHSTPDCKPWGFWREYKNGNAHWEGYDYKREGSQVEWWKTAKRRGEV